MRQLLAAFRALLARRRFEREMREELAAHIEHRADDLVARGLSRDDARRQARVEFGALEAYKEECRDASGFFALRLLHGLGGDLKLAARRLAATPLFTLFAVLSLGIGLGVTAAAYSVVSAVAFVSPGILDEDRVAFVMTGWDGREQDERRRADAARMKAYALAAEPYLEAFGRLDPLSAGSRRRILAS